MRAILGGAAAAAILALSSTLAFASQHDEGIVKAYSHYDSMLALKDGKTFVLPPTFKEPGIRSDVKVKVAYNVKGGKDIARSVAIVN